MPQYNIYSPGSCRAPDGEQCQDASELESQPPLSIDSFIFFSLFCDNNALKYRLCYITDILWHTDPLLGNDHQISKLYNSHCYVTAPQTSMFIRQQENTVVIEKTFSTRSVPGCYNQDKLTWSWKKSLLVSLKGLSEKINWLTMNRHS
jgi:hypothetical protein